MARIDLLERVKKDRRDLFNRNRLLESMNKNALDGVVAVSPTNATYTSGALFPTMHPPGVLVFVVTTSDGNQGAVINEMDFNSFTQSSWIDNVRVYEYNENIHQTNLHAVEQFCALISDLGLASGQLGLESAFIPQAYVEKMQMISPKTHFVEGDEVFEYARLIKTPSEIEVFRLAAYYTDKAILTAFALSRIGDTEKDLASKMRALVLEMGADDLVHAHFQTGVHSTVVHAWPMEIPLSPGEVVHVDTGAVFGGYRTDLARNAVVEKASPEQETIYRQMWEIEQILLEIMKPGTVACEIYDMAQGEFDKVGLKYPWGTLGHSTGITGHEGFEIASDSNQILEAGMLVNIEPSHIEKGDARYHIEDTVLITDNGPEILSNFANTEELFVIM